MVQQRVPATAALSRAQRLCPQSSGHWRRALSAPRPPSLCPLLRRYDGYGRSQSGGARYDSGSQYGRQYGSEGRYGRYDEAARYDAQQYGRQQSGRYSEAGGGGGGAAAKRARLSYGELANEGGGGGGYQRGRNRR